MSAVPKQQAFLKAFTATGSITIAAAAVGIDRSNHYQWLKQDPEYKAAFDEAVVEASGFLEDTAIERATVGWEEPVVYQGQLAEEPVKDAEGRQIFVPEVDELGNPILLENGDPRMARLMKPLTVRKKSDALLQTLLKAWLPKKYRENVHVDGNISHSGLSALSDEELDRIARGGSGGVAPAPDAEEQVPDVLPGDGASEKGSVPEAPGVLPSGPEAPRKAVPRSKPRRKD